MRMGKPNNKRMTVKNSKMGKKRGMKAGGKCKGAGAATKGTRYSKS